MLIINVLQVTIKQSSLNGHFLHNVVWRERKWNLLKKGFLEVNPFDCQALTFDWMDCFILHKALSLTYCLRLYIVILPCYILESGLQYMEETDRLWCHQMHFASQMFTIWIYWHSVKRSDKRCCVLEQTVI